MSSDVLLLNADENPISILHWHRAAALLLDDKVRMRLLTMDHVVPRSRSERGQVILPWSGEAVPVTGWRNVTTACENCNRHKADRTPQEAGMKLRSRPRPPTMEDAMFITLARMHIPAEWAEHI